MNDPRDFTLNQAKVLGDHLLPQFREAMREELEPVHARLAALEGERAARGRGWAAVISAVTFVGTVLGGAVWSKAKEPIGPR